MVAVPGNDEVIRTLEPLLAHAKEGRVGYFIGLMISEHGQRMSGGWSGCHSLEKMALQAMEQLMFNMNADFYNKNLPERPPGVTADRVCYNVPRSPLSYDFIVWLVDAEMTRRREGAPAPLKVGFWFGRDGKTGLEQESRARMFDKVLRPALALIGAVEDETAIDGRWKDFFSARDIVAGYRNGENIPYLSPVSSPWSNHMGCVTITLRECDHFPHRNSNMDAWLKFAFHLKAQGERVVFVRDTSVAREQIDGFDICPAASLDLDERMALYYSAKMNLFVSNGPATLGYFSDWPWMIFIPIEGDDSGYMPNTAKFWSESAGIEVGTQFPWCRRDQRIVWQPDTYENLVAAWDDVYSSEAHSVAAE